MTIFDGNVCILFILDSEEEEFYEQKMREQQIELEKLMQEREKLMKLRADLDRVAQDNRNSISEVS